MVSIVCGNWCQPISLVELNNMKERAQGLQKKKNNTAECSRYLYHFFFTIEHSALMILVFCYKDMFKNIKMQSTQQLLAFSLLPEEPN